MTFNEDFKKFHFFSLSTPDSELFPTWGVDDDYFKIFDNKKVQWQKDLRRAEKSRAQPETQLSFNWTKPTHLASKKPQLVFQNVLNIFYAGFILLHFLCSIFQQRNYINKFMHIFFFYIKRRKGRLLKNLIF